MSQAETKQLIAAYYDAFNRGEPEAMEAMLHDDFEHHVNEGGIRRGKDGFAAFNRHMSETYRENLTDMVIFANEDGSRGAAEFVVNGTYLKTDPGLPEARGQSYCLPAGTFFAIRDGKIARVTTYYNLADWVRQVS
ncbi:ketosteroid isomerase-related protein [Paracoccus sp. (in: a-proteobacteria)]|uniref:ketosteroid isomerase-related protein n=1 Tax=Paracoccus sp. TaxID=267 RepID=UPI0026E09178|nr:ketosteroid isomerase-related protein [Paracoccus sp. (in: a-proteobacteria)]MDO5371372.1 ketosteroid isomerase-related protein [Paracoccus sp. (in: a-proteobacteria)]